MEKNDDDSGVRGLSTISFLERAAFIHGDQTSIVIAGDSSVRFSWEQTHQRRLITVAAALRHFGIPCGAVSEKELINMKQVRDDAGLPEAEIKVATTPPPSRPPPLPRFKICMTESVTNREIANFWMQKRVEEEDHLLAAIKAAARIRARKFSEEDYKCFLDSLEGEDEDEDKDATSDADKNENSEEIRIGIKDWWTKSKYAYLNQPESKPANPPKRRSSSFVPNCFSFHPKTSLYPTSYGVL